MLGVGLRKLCPLDSFGDAFRKKKTVRKSIPGGCKTGPRGVQNGLWKASGQLGPTWRQGRSEAVFGRLVALLEPSWGPPGRAGPLLGASWGSFGDLPRADLDDLDVLGGAM